MTPAPARFEAETGAGLLGTVAGFAVFCVMLLVAVQVLFDLYATTVVTGAAHDAARRVASADAEGRRCAAALVAEREFVAALGGYGRDGRARLRIDCTDPDVVRARVVADHPDLVPSLVGRLTGLGRVDRTLEIRTETLR
ncbi:MAG: hypothetical protein D6683_14515 [Actinomyces sp.]|nr:MAG: hypothetical protein D6683_14515 [Actinomyces sp.]